MGVVVFVLISYFSLIISDPTLIGNYYGGGETRRKELQRSAMILDLVLDHVAIINDRFVYICSNMS